MFNEDLFEGKLTLNCNEQKKYMTIEMKDTDSGCLHFCVKAKFFVLNPKQSDSESELMAPRLRVKLLKKRGDI